LLVRTSGSLSVESQRRLVEALDVGRAGCDQWGSVGPFLIGVVVAGRGGILAPAGLQGLCDGLRARELEVAGFLGNDGTFWLWLAWEQAW